MADLALNNERVLPARRERASSSPRAILMQSARLAKYIGAGGLTTRCERIPALVDAPEINNAR